MGLANGVITFASAGTGTCSISVPGSGSLVVNAFCAILAVPSTAESGFRISVAPMVPPTTISMPLTFRKIRGDWPVRMAVPTSRIPSKMPMTVARSIVVLSGLRRFGAPTRLRYRPQPTEI